MSGADDRLGIAAISEFLPQGTQDNASVSQAHGFDESFISEKLGIRQRHIAAPQETTADLAAGAGQALFEETGVDPASVELLVVVTQTPDYMLPHVSALVHQRLGLGQHTAAFDIGLGCSGYVYALATVLPMMAAHGMGCGLLITAETYSKLIDPGDRATAPLFGDGATATLVGPLPRYRVGKCSFGTDGSRHEALIAHGSGLKPEDRRPLFMDGRAIFNFMMTEVPQDIDRCLAMNGFERGDIDLWVFHQASAYMLRTLSRRLGIAEDKLVIEMADTGNTTASSIPLALRRQVLARDPVPGRVLISGFGVGLSWATAVLEATGGDG